MFYEFIVQNFKGRLRVGLFSFRIAKMERFFEVFLIRHLKETPDSDDSDKVVFSIPMTPTSHSDRHKKNGHIFRYVRSCQGSYFYSTPIFYLSSSIGSNWHRFLG